MSWLFSQALAEEYLEDICSDGKQSVQSNGKPIQQAYCAPDKMTDFYRVSQFGMMFKPLTENLGEELLMSYLADFHAKTLVQQAEVQESQEQEVQCGDTWHGLLGKYDHNLHLWRTVQCSLLEDLEQSLEIFPRWGMTRNGVCWERQTLELDINETEFGYWPTPTATQMPSEGSILQYRKLVDQGVLTQEEAEGMLMASLNPPRMKKWTPDNKTFFHTPNTTGLDGGSNSRKALKKRQMEWPTPQASDNRDRGNMSNPSIQRRIAKGKQIMLSQSVHPTSGKLNPTWVEWLMGWPLGWTDLKPLEMDKSHCVQQQPGIS